MRLLLSMTSTSAYPFYLLPDWLLIRIPLLQRHPRSDALKWWRPGTGRVEAGLFDEGLYDGEEFNFLLAGVIDGAGRVNWDRVERYRETGRSFEAFHGANVNEYPSHADLGFNLAEPSEELTRILGVQIELSAYLSSRSRPLFNIHVGAVPGERADEEERRRGLDRVVETVESLLPLLEAHDMLFALENGFDVLPGRRVLGSEAWEFEYLMERLDHPLVGVTLDWGHANIQATLAASERPPEERPGVRDRFLADFIDRLGDRIVYAHLHYNDAHRHADSVRWPWWSWTRGRDQHAPLTRVPPGELEAYRAYLHRLARETGIGGTGLVHAEVVRRRVFGWMVAMPLGAEFEDFRGTAAMIRRALAPHPVPLDGVAP